MYCREGKLTYASDWKGGLTMKGKALSFLLAGVFFAAGALLIVHNFDPQDDPALTSAYVEGVEVFVPPEVEVVENFSPGNLEPLVIEFPKYEKISKIPGFKNYMKTSLVASDCKTTRPAVRIDYYSAIIFTEEIRYVFSATSNYLPPSGKKLKWGIFHPEHEGYYLDTAKGKVYFPMKYAHGNCRLVVTYGLLCLINLLVCAAATMGTWKLLKHFASRNAK
jgi:hypothetical protein